MHGKKVSDLCKILLNYIPINKTGKYFEPDKVSGLIFIMQLLKKQQ